ncbi:MAG: YdaU family protein [Rhizobiales bacterium]|nr:YdaU family protein [Hyphomicrobiales bacterium]
MSSRPWYKRFPADFIAGTVHLSAEEKGVYSTLLDLLYLKHAPIVDDGKELARICGCSTRRFNCIKQTLIDRGKITVNDGKISNPRFDRQNLSEKKEAEKFEINGRKGGDKSAEKRASNNENSALDHEWVGSQNQPVSDAHILRKKKEGGASAPADELPNFVAPERPAGKSYVFEGNTVRLTKDSLDKWRASYKAIPDLRAELQAADDYYTENPPRDGKWFFPVSRWLAKANADAVERKEQANYGVTWQ